MRTLRPIRSPIAYPAKKPKATIAAAVISNTVFLRAMLTLQKNKKVGGVTQYYFTRADVNKAAKTGVGEIKLAANNMQRYFKQNKTATTANREQMMQFIDDEARTQLLKVAGKDGKLTPNEATKLPRWVRDDYNFITTGKLPK